MSFFGIVPTAIGTHRHKITRVPLQPQGDFGHPPMDLAEIVPHLRDRMAKATLFDDVAVSKRELTMLLDAIECGAHR